LLLILSLCYYFVYGDKKIYCGLLKVILKARYRIFSLLLSVWVVFSCNTTPKETIEGGGSETQPAQPRQPLSGGLVEEIRSLTETGVLSSMLQALDLIQNRGLGSVDFGRMMSGVNILLIRQIYPDSMARLPVFDIPQTYNYSRIIREAERGNYIRPPENSSDFLEHILPSLAVSNQTGTEIAPTALRDLAKAAELRPSSILPHFFQGYVYERQGRLRDAETAYRRAYNISNECYPALIAIARLRRLAGNTAEAVALFSDLIVRYPDSLDIKRQLAVTYFESKNWSRSLSAIDEVLQADPRDGEFLLMKARIHIEQGQFSQANAPLDTYASINPNNRSYLFLRARVQAEGNRNRDSALNYLRSILRTNSDDVEVMVYAAGLLLESQRASDQEEGRELLTRLRRTAGSSIDVLSLSLNDAVRRENWQEAQGYLNRILSVRRTPSDLTDAYHIERGLGNNARALTFARELYERDTSNNDYTAIYISALIDNNRRDEASRLLESRLNSAGGGSVKSRLYFLRSRIQTDQEAALGDLRSSIFEDPRNLDALIAMFEIYHNRREERRAVYYLRQALAIAPDNPRLKRYEREYASLLEGR
jgi:tetratricopeptide (TPR) repeat protein